MLGLRWVVDSYEPICASSRNQMRISTARRRQSRNASSKLPKFKIVGYGYCLRDGASCCNPNNDTSLPVGKCKPNWSLSVLNAANQLRVDHIRLNSSPNRTSVML